MVLAFMTRRGNAIDLIFSAEYRMVLDLPGKEFQVPPQPPSIKSDWSSHTRFLGRILYKEAMYCFSRIFSMTFHRYGRD